jgi:nucleotide-binding universal stress UspA family protein
MNDRFDLRFGSSGCADTASHLFEHYSPPTRRQEAGSYFQGRPEEVADVPPADMKPPDTILLPIDTRDCPLEAFSYINQFASHYRTVILLHVVNLNVVPPDGRVFDDLSRAAEKNLLRLSERFLDQRFFVRHQIRFGRPAQEILNEARESNVDLITLTSHGSGSFWKRFHPRIVQKVLRAAPCDVMLLHARTRFNCDEDWDRADEIVSSIEHAGLLRVQAHSLV